MRRHSGFSKGAGLAIPAALLAMSMGGRGWGRGWGCEDSGGEGGGWGRQAGRKRRFGSEELRLVLLQLIADEPRHGYDLIRAIEELTHGTYAPSPGVVYPSLTMLQDMGLIEETASGGTRKVYAATAEGKARAAEKADEIAGLFERLSGLGEGRRRAGGGPVGRAVTNLMAAVWSRATHAAPESETLHDIAAILDDAAQRIERLK